MRTTDPAKAQAHYGVYQFKIVLEGMDRPIWRRIVISSDSTFWDLHVAIQDAMGWGHSRSHEFLMIHPSRRQRISIGLPDEERHEAIHPSWKKRIAHYFSRQNPDARYTYGFHDGWEHTVILEKIQSFRKKQYLPRCIGGERACPPEDCGGVDGYQRWLTMMNKSDHKEDLVLGKGSAQPFDPEAFTRKAITFSDPNEQLTGWMTMGTR